MKPYRIPEPKPVTILLLTLAGAAAYTGAWFVTGRQIDIKGALCLGIGLGAAVGVNVCLAERGWIRILAAPFLGTVGIGVSLVIYDLEGARRGFSSDFLELIWIGTVITMSLVLVHDLNLRSHHAIVSPLLFAIIGSISGLSAMTFAPEFGATAGATHGVTTYLAILAASAIDRRMPRSPDDSR